MARLSFPRTEHRGGGLAAGYLAILLVISILGLVVHFNADVFSDRTMAPPSLGHPLGTDDLGRDVLRGILEGTQVSIAVGLASAFAAVFLGILIGALCGYYGGIFDLVVMRITEIFQVMPNFIMAAVIVALSGPGLTRIIFVIAILAWPQVARLMRAEVMRVKQMEFVDAVRCLGFRESRILMFEVIPNALGPVLAISTLIVGQAILLESSLSFLGLSSPDVTSWGRMLNNGQRFLFNAWWMSLFPGLAILLTVLAFNILGDVITSALDKRNRR